MLFNRSIFFLLLCIFPIMVFSQDSTSRKKKHEIGMNTTLLIKQVLGLNSTNIPFSPYLLTYRYAINSNTNFRAGAGLIVQKTASTENDINKRYSKSYAMDYRIGIEKQNRLTERWKAYYGIDLIYTYSEILSETSFGSFNNQVKGYGAGPVVGIQFYLNKRMSLFAEASLYYSNVDERTKNTSTSPFGQNSTSHSNILRGEFKLPTTLYLAFKL
jgi:hypothetical protein